jgi:hypothetical protein
MCMTNRYIFHTYSTYICCAKCLGISRHSYLFMLFCIRELYIFSCDTHKNKYDLCITSSHLAYVTLSFLEVYIHVIYIRRQMYFHVIYIQDKYGDQNQVFLFRSIIYVFV